MVQAYVEKLKKALTELSSKEVEALAKLIYTKHTKNKRIYIAGNGGSAATASHWSCDLQKTTLEKNYKNFNRLNIVCLNDNMPLVTAWANDYGYEHIFSEQLLTLGKKGDLFIAITGSGNSQNILNALTVANKQGIETFALLGFDGGKAYKLAKSKIVVKSNHYGVIEDMHMIIGHIVTDLLKPKIAKRHA